MPCSIDCKYSKKNLKKKLNTPSYMSLVFSWGMVMATSNIFSMYLNSLYKLSIYFYINNNYMNIYSKTNE